MKAGERRTGELLVERGILTAQNVERALIEQGRTGLPLLSTVLRLGWADEGELVALLSEQLGVPGADLSTSVISSEVLALVPHEVARAHHILPLALRDKSLQLAIANPGSSAVLDEIAFATGCEVLPFVALRTTIEAAIEDAYGKRRQGQPLWRGVHATANEPTVSVRLPPQKDTPEIDTITDDDSFPVLEPVEAPVHRPSNAVARVLAVDDEEAILDLVERALATRGIEVVRATRGRQALELLRTHQPDIVLLDAMLPEIHGFEICSNIKGSDGYRHIPVIIISAIYTGWNFALDVKRLYGADDYMAKPFRVVELVRKVEELLERTKARPKALDVQQAAHEAAREAKRAADAFQAGKLEVAHEAARRATMADPFDARAHFILGSVLQSMGDVYQSISEFERVVELAPSMFGALKNLAALYERQGFRAKAVEMWTRALDHSPSDAVRQTIKAHIIGLL
ncbi:MAG: response regulator [Myxococcota bacterium]